MNTDTTLPKPQIDVSGVATFLFVNGEWRPVKWQDEATDPASFVKAIQGLHGHIELGEPVVLLVKEKATMNVRPGDYQEDEAQAQEAQKTV